MTNHINNPFYKALELKYAAQVEDAKAKITLYFSNPAGVADHSGITEELDCLLHKMSAAMEKVYQLRQHFGPQSVKDVKTKANDGETKAQDVPKTSSI
jgi:hypothetical protein